MDRKELDKILLNHKKWIDGEPDGKRAVLRFKDLENVDFKGANLKHADLTGSNLRGADLSWADLWGADLWWADLRWADLWGAVLLESDLRMAHLCDADLRYAVIRDADLRGADLRGAMLENADTDNIKTDAYTEINWPMACPETGSFIAWKKACGCIVKLEIPADAERSSATTKRCRASKAMVLEIYNKEGTNADVTEVESMRGGVYKVGEMVYPDSWDDNRWNECSHGIHFFMTRDDAVAW